jgi:sulfatase maturation enzyme AslB (radical SAM superfamily)
LYDEYPDGAPDWPWASQLINSRSDKEAVPATIARAIREYGDYGKYVAEVRSYTPEDICKLRCSYCREMLEEYDQPEFLTFRYSDESYFSEKQRTIGRRYISRK